MKTKITLDGCKVLIAAESKSVFLRVSEGNDWAGIYLDPIHAKVIGHAMLAAAAEMELQAYEAAQ